MSKLMKKTKVALLAVSLIVGQSVLMAGDGIESPRVTAAAQRLKGMMKVGAVASNAISNAVSSVKNLPNKTLDVAGSVKDHVCKYKYAYGVVGAAAGAYVMVRLYNAAKVKAARGSSKDVAMLKRLQAIEKELSAGNLNKSERKALENVHSTVVEEMVSKHFEGQSLINEVKAILKAVNPL